LVALLPRLRRFAYGLCGSKDEGDDLVQAACERALSRLDQWQEGTRLDSWMFRVVQTIWIDRIRAQKVRGIVSDITDADHLVGDDGTRSTEARLTLNTVREAIADLPEDQRIVLVMVSVDGRSYKETAEALDLPIGTVTSRLARARLRLHAAVHGSAGPDTAPENSAKEPERG
jgi:RNA polymerase sigma-70 factor (ECF subfamily)